MARMKRSAPAYHTTNDGDVERSDPTYTCKFCGMRGLYWGPLGAGRRLFHADHSVHLCLPKNHPRCAAPGFADLVIPIESYEQ